MLCTTRLRPDGREREEQLDLHVTHETVRAGLRPEFGSTVAESGVANGPTREERRVVLRRYERLVSRKRRLWLLLGLPVALLGVAAATVVGSGAIFTSTSANPANVFTAGILTHSNSKSGTAILTASLMKPGDSSQGSVTIKNTGNLEGTFSLTTSNLTDTPGANGGNLSEVLQLTIVDTTTSQTLYSGPIDSVGTVDAGNYEPDDEHTYQFTVTFPDSGLPGTPTTGDNLYQGSSMSIDFNWTAVQQ